MGGKHAGGKKKDDPFKPGKPDADRQAGGGRHGGGKGNAGEGEAKGGSK